MTSFIKLISCDSSRPNGACTSQTTETLPSPRRGLKVLNKAARLFTKLNRKTTCQRPQQELFIDFHGSCFSLITLRATVQLESETSEETLLPTWNCQNQWRKAPNPKANWEPIVFNYTGWFFLQPGVAAVDALMAGGICAYAHFQYAIVAFLHGVGPPAEGAENHCQVKRSSHRHTSTFWPSLETSNHYTRSVQTRRH